MRVCAVCVRVAPRMRTVNSPSLPHSLPPSRVCSLRAGESDSLTPHVVDHRAVCTNRLDENRDSAHTALIQYGTEAPSLNDRRVARDAHVAPPGTNTLNSNVVNWNASNPNSIRTHKRALVLQGPVHTHTHARTHTHTHTVVCGGAW